MAPVISINKLSKTYKGGFSALKEVSLDIEKGEIFALLGPNGAGKTTLIATICGLVRPTSGSVRIGNADTISNYRQARAQIGLVPQEISLDIFGKVIDTVNFSRGLFGKKPNPALIEQILRDLSLWDKKDAPIMSLSGGMKRRVIIAKALAHEPSVLFLDEPTAGVDVELRRDMWQLVRKLREGGTTIILTTHYIEEAEEMADRVGVINHGELILVEQTAELMQRMGKKELKLQLAKPLKSLTKKLQRDGLHLSEDGTELTFVYDTRASRTGISKLVADLSEAKIIFKDLETTQSSLEEIFVGLVEENA